jgi:hypothetical protein
VYAASKAALGMLSRALVAGSSYVIDGGMIQQVVGVPAD